MTSSEKHSRGDGSGERTTASLPAVRHSAFAKHWLAVDEGGAELTTAIFGAPAKRLPRRPALQEKPVSCPQPSFAQIAPAPTRLRSTVMLLLLVLTILFAVPATNFIGRL